MTIERGRRLLYVLAAATLAVVCVTAGVLLGKSVESRRSGVAPAPSPVSVHPEVAAPASQPAPPSRKPTLEPHPESGSLAAVTKAGNVVLVDPDTAQVVRTIYSANGSALGEHVAWHAASGVVYFSRSEDGCPSIWRDGLRDSANPKQLTNGERLAVSPDGTMLAVSTCRDGERAGIAVVDAESGKPALAVPLSTEPFEEGGGMWYVGDIDWRPDGKALVVTAGWEGDDAQFLVDLGKPPRSVTAAPPVTVQRPEVSFHELTYVGQRLVMYGTCCFPEATKSRVVVRDGKTGVVTDLKATTAAGVTADAKGRMRYLHSGRSESPHALWALDRLDGVPRKIGGEFVAIDW